MNNFTVGTGYCAMTDLSSPAFGEGYGEGILLKCLQINGFWGSTVIGDVMSHVEDYID